MVTMNRAALVLFLLPFATIASPLRPSTSQVIQHEAIGARDTTPSNPYDPKGDTAGDYRIKTTFCDEAKQQTIINAVAEAGYLAGAGNEWMPNGAFQNSLDKWMGGGDAGVKTTFQNNWSLHSGQQLNVNWPILMFCGTNDDEVVRFTNCKNGATAFSFPEDSKQYVVFCDKFFDTTNAKPLADMLKQVGDQTSWQKSMHPVYRTTAFAMHHETFHWRPIVNPIETWDIDGSFQVYGPQNVETYVKGHPVSQIVKYADPYAMAAGSNFMMIKYGLTDPPSSYKPSGWDNSLNPDPMLIENVDPTGIFQPTTDDDNLDKRASVWKKFSVAVDATINPDDYAPIASNPSPSPVPNPPTEDPPCDDGDNSCNFVSKCGDEWMPLADWTVNGVPYIGYTTAVQKFCKALDGKQLSTSLSPYATMYTEVGLDLGKDPASNGQVGYIEFEIHTTWKDHTHGVVDSDCQAFLLQMGLDPPAKGSNCYGKDHKDTKGGTYQLGKSEVSYHGLAKKNKPSKVELDSPVYGSGPANGW